MYWLRMVIVIVGCVVAGALAGCGSGPASASISGEVKVDGVPVEKGVISFSSLDGTGAPVTGEIKNGRYEVRTTAGNKQVRISVPVVTGKQKESNAPDAKFVEITAESLPAKYHSRSELTFDVKSGSNTKNWDLVVKKQ